MSEWINGNLAGSGILARVPLGDGGLLNALPEAECIEELEELESYTCLEFKRVLWRRIKSLLSNKKER